MNTDLILQLSKLTPTEGVWEAPVGYIMCGNSFLFDFDSSDAKQDDVMLVKLAPAMRLEILKMAKEIEDIRNALQIRLNLIQSEPNGIVRETMIQNLLLDI